MNEAVEIGGALILLFLVVVGAWGAIGDALESRSGYCKLCGYRCNDHTEEAKRKMED